MFESSCTELHVGGCRGRGYSSNKDFETKTHAEGQASSSQQDIRIVLPPPDCPYEGWHLYMREAYRKDLESIPLIEVFEEYFERYKFLLNDIFDGEEIDEYPAVQLNMQKVFGDKMVQNHIPNLRIMIYHSPQNMINIIGLAAHQTITNTINLQINVKKSKAVLTTDNGEILESSIHYDPLPLVNARLANFSKSMTPKYLNSTYLGKFVTVKGIVVRVGKIKQYFKRMAFSCLVCGSVQGVIQPEGKYTEPSSCTQSDCKSRYFEHNLSHPSNNVVDCQSIKVEDKFYDDLRDEGTVLHSIDCKLMEDLVFTCIPGDTLILSGIVKVSQNEETKEGMAEKSIRLYIDVNSLINPRFINDAAPFCGRQFSVEDHYDIWKLQSKKELFRALVASLCPEIYGIEMVKAGLILCLFGGCSKIGRNAPVRGTSHILIVGDPGVGKTRILQACSNVAPIGVYVHCNETTTSNLTATLTSEPDGDVSLARGPVVLGDKGICCIDECDKMTKQQRKALLEPMEKGVMIIEKYDVECLLSVRTSVLAAANPVGGHYNRAKTLLGNLKMSRKLLSLFDLVFVLGKKNDKKLDSLHSEHVMSKHIGGRTSQRSQNWTQSSRVTREDLTNTLAPRNEEPLSERLKFSSLDEVDFIPHHIIRKYIFYARKFARPRLSKDAAKVIRNFLVELREKLPNSNSTPITRRQLEPLVRLSEARARCELRNKVTESDAKDVIEIMKISMTQSIW